MRDDFWPLRGCRKRRIDFRVEPCVLFLVVDEEIELARSMRLHLGCGYAPDKFGMRFHVYRGYNSRLVDCRLLVWIGLLNT